MFRSTSVVMTTTCASELMELSPVSELIAAMGKARPRGLHVTFSQDDYSRSVGGSQLCVQREAAEFAVLERNHLHVHPANGWPTVRSGPMSRSPLLQPSGHSGFADTEMPADSASSDLSATQYGDLH